MDEAAQRSENKHIYKQDIDDNCPMTGDETDTDTNAYVDDAIAAQLSDGDNSFTVSGIKRNPTEISPIKLPELEDVEADADADELCKLFKNMCVCVCVCACISVCVYMCLCV